MQNFMSQKVYYVCVVFVLSAPNPYARKCCEPRKRVTHFLSITNAKKIDSP